MSTATTFTDEYADAAEHNLIYVRDHCGG